MHQLQTVFADEAGETGWSADMHALFAAGAFDQAEALLAESLAALDTELAWTCLELPRENVVLSGWDELAEAITLHEGPPVTGVTIAVANDADRAFDKGALHSPHVLLGIYTDEAFAFSQASPWQLLDECQSATPGWAGREEDIEVHLALGGLDALNTALIHHKQRHFFRDGEVAAAPLRYVEYVACAWWRALRWHQAVARAAGAHGMPRAVPVVAGMVDMRPDAVAIHTSGHAVPARPTLQLVAGRDVASASFGEGFIQRRASDDASEPVSPATVIALRRRMKEEREAEHQSRGRGLLGRLFGPRRAG